MDPYLEVHWLDVQVSLIAYSRDQLQPQLGGELIARAEQRLVVEDPVGLSRRIGPDVQVVEHGLPGEPVRPTSGVAVAEPMVFKVASDPIIERYLEIRDLTSGGRVITVIEFVSPTNKFPGDGRRKYQQKQQECRDADVNRVEIDLTRAGRRELLVHRWAGARLHESTYQVSIWRSAYGSQCELYSLRLQNRLPAIREPLRPTDTDAVLDLQSLIDAAHQASRFDRTTDYRRPCEPPLAGEEAEWMDQMLRTAGVR